jgi:DnaJ-class molecular chaperone
VVLSDPTKREAYDLTGWVYNTYPF